MINRWVVPLLTHSQLNSEYNVPREGFLRLLGLRPPELN